MGKLKEIVYECIRNMNFFKSKKYASLKESNITVFALLQL